MDVIHDNLNKYITYGIIILCTCAVTASYTCVLVASKMLLHS